MRGKNTKRRRQRKRSPEIACILILLIWAIPLHAQLATHREHAKQLSISVLQQWVYPASCTHSLLSKPVSYFSLTAFAELQLPDTPTASKSSFKNVDGFVAPNMTGMRWDANALPFFCRIEHKLGKKNRVPVKFRLGSVEYVDWLEGKPGCTSFQ